MNPKITKLPLDCEAHYYEDFLNPEESKLIYDYVTENCDLKRTHVKTPQGNSYKLNRSTVIFTDEETLKQGIIPKTWGEDSQILIWPQPITHLKDRIEKLTGKQYNICLCNFYANGKRNIGWHSDKEEYGSVSSIASISLGTERLFEFREINNFENIHGMLLANGSLLLMGDNCQERYQHRVTPDKTIKMPRLNLTFRLFDKQRYTK